MFAYKLVHTYGLQFELHYPSFMFAVKVDHLGNGAR